MEVNLAFKKCDKVLQSDQHFRQHLKEHKRLNEQLIECHHCDFITNDEDTHVNHMVDVHSTKHTCNSCDAVFPTNNNMIEHAGNEHGFIYNLLITLKQTMELVKGIKEVFWPTHFLLGMRNGP